MEDEQARAFNALKVRMLALENAIDTIFSLAAGMPQLREALVDGLQLRTAAVQDGMASSNDAGAKQVFREASERLLQALEPPRQAADGSAPT